MAEASTSHTLSASQQIAYAVIKRRNTTLKSPWEIRFNRGPRTVQSLWNAKFGGHQLDMFSPPDDTTNPQKQAATGPQDKGVEPKIEEESDDGIPIAFGFSHQDSTVFQEMPGSKMPKKTTPAEIVKEQISEGKPKQSKNKRRVKKNDPLQDYPVWQEYKMEFEVSSSPVEELVNIYRPRATHGTSECGCRQCVKRFTEESNEAESESATASPQDSPIDQNLPSRSSTVTLSHS